MTKHEVAAVGELAEGQCKLVRVDDAETRVVPHRRRTPRLPQLLPACRCAVVRVTPAGGAVYERGREPLSLRCPWHGWEFDLRTGAFVGNPRCTLDAFRVEIVDGTVCVWA